MAEINTDLLIIGGGVTGLYTAYLCRKKKYRLHAHRIPGNTWEKMAFGRRGNGKYDQ